MSDAYVQKSQRYVRTLGRRHSMASVARMLRVGTGTLQNLWRGRLKTVPVDLYMRLCDAVAAELQHEIRRLEHELALVMAGADRGRTSEVASMVAQIETMKLTMEERDGRSF